MEIGKEVYWLYDGDVIEGSIIAFDKHTVKIKTPEGLVFGKVGNDDYECTHLIWHSDIAFTKEEAIKLLKKKRNLTRITLNTWNDSLYDLVHEKD